MNGFVTFRCDDSVLQERLKDLAALTGREFPEEVKAQSALLSGDLMKMTPPLSGKSIVKALDTRGAKLGFRNAEIEDMSARQIGNRRVEKDVRKVFYGVKPVNMTVTFHTPNGRSANRVVQSYNFKGAFSDIGIQQRCEGRDAVRLFATKTGVVYGVDRARWKSNMSMEEMRAIHDAQRGTRGRVTMAGQRTRDIGRWRWVNMIATREPLVQAFIKLKQAFVGEAKGGWAEAFIELGGRMSRSGWVGKHARRAGDVQVKEDGDGIEVTIHNRSIWASSGDDQRIIPRALAGRGKAITERMMHIIKARWEKTQH